MFSKERISNLIKLQNWTKLLSHIPLNEKDIVEKYYQYGQQLKPYVVDSSLFINNAIDDNKMILMEGAQGTMLDVDHGTYPYVTSSNPIAGASCIGAGIGPHKIAQVIGVTKAYATRVGEGPFPTELTDDSGEYLREKGAEFGTTTGRPRRCGWLDLVVIRYAVRVNGITETCLTKLDVLDELDTIYVCNSYQHENGDVIKDFPLDPEVFSNCKPIYENISGWKSDISQITDYDALPTQAKDYIKYIEELTKVPISMVSVGSKRKQVIHLLKVD